jgi:hypothetical protein
MHSNPNGWSSDTWHSPVTHVPFTRQSVEYNVQFNSIFQVCAALHLMMNASGKLQQNNCAQFCIASSESLTVRLSGKVESGADRADEFLLTCWTIFTTPCRDLQLVRRLGIQFLDCCADCTRLFFFVFIFGAISSTFLRRLNQ